MSCDPDAPPSRRELAVLDSTLDSVAGNAARELRNWARLLVAEPLTVTRGARDDVSEEGALEGPSR